MRTDTTLTAARRGDLAAFNRLVLEHQATVYNVAHRVLGDERAAAEVTQAAFVSALQELPAFREGPFQLWVLRWLVQACQPWLGRASRQSAAGSLPRAAAAEAPLPHCLAALPPGQCLALALVDIAGLDYAQAALVLGASVARVRADLASARRALSGALAGRIS
jgi:RNA polymerase sigma-70 factor (ECF subfamily)